MLLINVKVTTLYIGSNHHKAAIPEIKTFDKGFLPASNITTS